MGWRSGGRWRRRHHRGRLTHRGRRGGGGRRGWRSAGAGAARACGDQRRCCHTPREPHGSLPAPAGGRGRSVLVRPKIATISGPSLATRSSFQPRFPMSARHPISFSHSLAVVRNTRRSATASHCGGYGGDGGEEGGGRAISRVLFARPRVGRWSSLWDGCRQPPRCGLPAARTTRAGSRCLFGLAPTGGHRAASVTRRAVGSYPTVSPLPLDAGRFVFCGPVRRLAAPRRYLAVYPVELGLSSAHPSCDAPRPSRPTATRRKLTGATSPEARLARQAPQQAPHAVIAQSLGRGPRGGRQPR